MADGDTIISIRDRLLKERHSLLDLSTRNRLLNTPLRTKNNRAIEIVDEKAEEVFRLLTSNKPLSFLPGVQLTEAERAELDPEDNVTGGIPQPEDVSVDERGVAVRHSDNRLQTRLTSEGLQKRLFDIWYDAQTLEQEQGVNILYLAFGLLRWFDNDSSDIARHAPLVLLPVKLERTSAADKFRLRWRDEPLSSNLTLQAKMKAEFSLTIADLDDEEDEIDIKGYCAAVAEMISKQNRWEVLSDAMVLGFFSFSKFLMYRDLDPDIWPQDAGIDTREMIVALLRDGFPESDPIISDTASIDDVIKPIELHHVVDADSSQTVVIAEAASGRSLVVKGPPGTGKSQTITNIIAAAIARGKKVLFVAEKMVALDVVYRRLRHVGLGPLALELHSNKANKRAVLEELKRTRDAQYRGGQSDLSIVAKLGESSDALNSFAKRLHQTLQPSGLTPQAILGRLARAQFSSAPTGFPLVGAKDWDREAFAMRRSLVANVAERRRSIGPVIENVWRGVRCDALDPAERAELGKRFSQLTNILGGIEDCAKVTVENLNVPPPKTIGDLRQISAILQVIPLPPSLDRQSLTESAWADLDALERLIDIGRTCMEKAGQVSASFNDIGRNADYNAIRLAFVTKGPSLFRFLNGEYRAQFALMGSYLKVALPKGQKKRVAMVDMIMAEQSARTAFHAAKPTGLAFGSAWKGEQSDWDKLGEILAWRRSHADLPEAVWQALATTSNLTSLEAANIGLEKLLPEFEQKLATLVVDLNLDLNRAFGIAKLSILPLHDLDDRLSAWSGDLEGLSRFVIFASHTRRLAELGLASLADGIHDGSLDDEKLAATFDHAYAEILRIALFNDWPELRAFDGEGHNNLVTRFRDLDKARISLAQEQIVATHANGRPRGAAGIGPLGVLNAEIARKRGHLPIRILLEKAGPAIQQLKPVFMMSPLSVAQFLKPGGIQFDILVIDEASQIEPVDALGSIARVKQIVVVGDEKQLPPTAFFRKLTGEDDLEDADENVTMQAKDAESILELCLAKGVPPRMLEWHYRSKHQSLIAVSNREFYDNKLFIVPSPYNAVAGMGLKFNLLKDTSYGRGETRTNAKEAKAVAEAVIQHARVTPDKTLGVATFSVAQRQAILKELELLRRANPDVEEFFSAAGHEPFFVKNLENIQGDERDVILISVGYGKTEQGYLAHSFGPLSRDGGERRLNVLISRAKQRCEVFCNFTGAEIDLERARGRGVACLKLFLTFAETGNFGLGEVTGEDFDSDFEMQVCERLQTAGYNVKRQIGASGFRVDLAVSDPDKPGRFTLGIECDGAQFHSSRSARDRDRLRQQVLEAHGWIIHRVWSADWYMRPQAELKKIEQAIFDARAQWVLRDEERFKPERAMPLSFESDVSVEAENANPSVGIDSTEAKPRNYYKEADFSVNRNVEPHETRLADMTNHIVKIVEIEGPVHADEITTRVRLLWGFSRAGGRIRATVERAIETAVQYKKIESGPFYQIPGKAINVRDRSIVHSLTLRRPEMLPPAEIDQSILTITGENFGANRDELIHAVAEGFGFSVTSAQLRTIVTARIDDLLIRGKLVSKGEILELM